MPAPSPFPLRAIYLLLIFLLTHTDAFGTIGHYYVIHARLEMKNGSIKNGYFNLAIEEELIGKNEDGYCYYSQRTGRLMKLHSVDSTAEGLRPAQIDYHFSHALLFQLYDTLDFFADAAVIALSTPAQRGELPIAAMLGSSAKIKKNDIGYIFLESIREISATAVTKLIPKDRTWIKYHCTFREDAGRSSTCPLEALSFQKPNASVLRLLNELRALRKEPTPQPKSNEHHQFTLKQSTSSKNSGSRTSSSSPAAQPDIKSSGLNQAGDVSLILPGCKGGGFVLVSRANQ